MPVSALAGLSKLLSYETELEDKGYIVGSRTLFNLAWCFVLSLRTSELTGIVSDVVHINELVRLGYGI